jgi:predicted transposase/invertase (TIGR01784 family)
MRDSAMVITVFAPTKEIASTDFFSSLSPAVNFFVPFSPETGFVFQTLPPYPLNWCNRWLIFFISVALETQREISLDFPLNSDRISIMKEKSKGKPHDSAYKYLFKSKHIFLQLLKSFVYEDFIKEIEPEHLTLFDKSFISEELLDRESDLIYKINYKDKSYFIYILPEFQSTVDKSIPVRLLSYIMLLYDLIYKESKAGLLSNIFPILLYNGKDDWNIPLNVNALIDRNIPDKYIPSFEYYLIVEKDIPDAVLDKLSNLVAAVVYMEKQNDAQKMLVAIDKVVEYIKDEDIIDIRMFTIWLTKMFRTSINQEDIDKIKDIKETKSMLTILAEEIRKEGKIEGKMEGKMEDAKKMKDKGLEIVFIHEITGLTIEEIEKL